ncbi:hypothetical protein L1887_47620 [Cichorium endivia]|nr:hypothetical protein L1887_47620 [Cichorium endivia]
MWRDWRSQVGQTEISTADREARCFGWRRAAGDSQEQCMQPSVGRQRGADRRAPQRALRRASRSEQVRDAAAAAAEDGCSRMGTSADGERAEAAIPGPYQSASLGTNDPAGAEPYIAMPHDPVAPVASVPSSSRFPYPRVLQQSSANRIASGATVPQS